MRISKKKTIITFTCCILALIMFIAFVPSLFGFTSKAANSNATSSVNVTLYMYSPDLEMTVFKSDIYIFENGGGKNNVLELTETYNDTDNNVTWLKGSITLSYNSLGIIARNTAGTWNGGQDGNRYFTIDENLKDITLWYVYGSNPVIDKPTIATSSSHNRYLLLEYTNDAKNLSPQFYSWTTGYTAKLTNFDSYNNGVWTIKIPIKSSCSKVDFVLALDASSSNWIKDGGDHSFITPLDQTVICASMTQGNEPILACPYNSGYEIDTVNQTATYFYRDDEALLNNTLSKLDVYVELDGNDYQMIYNSSTKRFEYTYDTLTNGKNYYRYHISDAYYTDKFNENKETIDGKKYSYFEHKKFDATLSASVFNSSFNYTQNNVLSFNIDGTDKDEFQITNAYCDLSSLGGLSHVNIDSQLQKLTFAVTDTISSGLKTIPITVTDQYNNIYKTTVKVEVTNKKITDTDFDWDESIIYFMLTDRFFDGNESNNTANGKQTYGNNGGLYHGGDFAGVTQKLDYLKELGINTIWMTPIVENIPGVNVTGTGKEDVPYNAAYHGYWASDFTKLNPALGTEAEFEKLIKEAHKRGIKIMVDIVINHAGYETEGTFTHLLRAHNNMVPGDDILGSLSNLPDFATEKNEVREQLVEWQTAWIKNYDIDYYRVDTVKHVDTTTWMALKNSLTTVNPKFKLIGEYFGAGYANNFGQLGTGMMDSLLDFDFNDQATSFVKGNLTSVESFLESRNSTINNTSMMGQFLSSHDETGFMQNLINSGFSKEEASTKSLLAATLSITAKGQPVIYYGEELGQTGENNYPYQTNRYDLDFTQATKDNAVYKHYKTLLSIRNKFTDIFTDGTRETISGSDNDGYIMFNRTYKKQSLIIGINNSDITKDVTLTSLKANTCYTDNYSLKNYKTDKEGNLTITLPKASDGGTIIISLDNKSCAKPTTSTLKESAITIIKNTANYMYAHIKNYFNCCI